MKRNRAICQEHPVLRWERVKANKVHTLSREKGSEQEHGKERVDSSVKEDRFQGGEGVQTVRASLREVEGSMSG